MAGTRSTPYASARSRSIARLSTSTVIWSESSATSRTSCSFCWHSSAASSDCEKATSFTGPPILSNSLRTAAWSRGLRMGMTSLYSAARSQLVPWRRRVLEEAAGEHDRVGKGDDATGWLERITDQLLELDPHETDLLDLAVHVSELALQAHPIPHPDPVRRDHREVARDGQDDVLKREGDPGGREAEGGHERRHFAGEVKDQNERDRDRDHDAPSGQEHPASPGVGDVTAHRHPPQRAPDEDDRQRHQDAEQIESEAL